MTFPTTPLTDAEIAGLISAVERTEPGTMFGREFLARALATITSLQSDLAEAEERATYYAANARGMDGPSDGSIYAAVSAMDAIKGERAALARALATITSLQSDLQAARDVGKAAVALYAVESNRADRAESALATASNTTNSRSPAQ